MQDRLDDPNRDRVDEMFDKEVEDDESLGCKALEPGPSAPKRTKLVPKPSLVEDQTLKGLSNLYSSTGLFKALEGKWYQCTKKIGLNFSNMPQQFHIKFLGTVPTALNAGVYTLLNKTRISCG